MENDPQKKQKYKIVIIIIICLLIGMIPGYLLGANLNSNNADIVNDTEEVEEEFEEVEEETNEEENNQEDEIVSKEEIEIQEKKEDTKPQEKKEDIQKDESKTQEKVEEKQKEEIPKAPESSQKVETITGTNPVINLKNECFNSQVCTKEYDISNGKNTIRIKIKRDSNWLTITGNNLRLLERRSYDPIIANQTITQIALLDNNYLVLEEQEDVMGKERYYYNKHMDNIITIRDAFYDDEHKITDSITSKEVTFIETNCFSIYGDDGKIDGQKYKLVLKDQDAYEVKYIGKERLAVGGQC